MGYVLVLVRVVPRSPRTRRLTQRDPRAVNHANGVVDCQEVPHRRAEAGLAMCAGSGRASCRSWSPLHCLPLLPPRRGTASPTAEQGLVVIALPVDDIAVPTSHRSRSHSHELGIYCPTRRNVHGELDSGLPVGAAERATEREGRDSDRSTPQHRASNRTGTDRRRCIRCRALQEPPRRGRGNRGVASIPGRTGTRSPSRSH